MQPDEIVSLFDQQAARYDRQWSKTAPIRDCLYLLRSPFSTGWSRPGGRLAQSGHGAR